MRRSLSWLLLAFVAVLALVPALPGTAQAAGPKVYVISIANQQIIDPGMAQIVKRGFDQAANDPAAKAVVLELDTPGGYTASAIRIKETIINADLPTVAYVTNMAASSGALIATASEKLFMHPGSTIGAAEVRVVGSDQPADYKTMSVWVGEFTSAAEYRGRDAALARAMVDKNAKVPGQVTELLVLTSKQAVEKGYANGEALTLDDALKQMGINNYEIVTVEPTLSDQVGRILTIPWVAILLLAGGVLAIAIEFMKPGVTVPGLIGVVCIALFFLGNILVGTAGMLEVGLALLGILLLLIEAFIPGFGVFGAGGIVSMVAAIFMAVPTPQQAMQYLMWTSIAFAVALFGIIRGLSRRGLGKALTLARHEKGFVPARADLSAMLGREGKALTVLRPAGTAQFGIDKVDVVTEGEFIHAGTQIKVIRVDGARVVVRSLE